MAVVMSRDRALAAVRAIFERYWFAAAKQDYDGFDKHLMADAVLLDASIGTPSAVDPEHHVGVPTPSILASATFSLLITPAYCNLNNVMHGGAAGVIFDMLTTSALGPLARPGYWDFLGGVTRSLNISYLRAIPLGTNVHIHSQVYQVGRTMAYIEGWMTSEDGKSVYCTCEHHKVNVPSQIHHMEPNVPGNNRHGGNDKPNGSKL